MSVFDAILLGLVQGVTSFLPVSSSGHVAVLEHFLGIESNIGAFLSVMLNLGTMVAIILSFWKDILKILTATLDIFRDIWKNICIFMSNAAKGQDNVYIKLLSSNYRRFAVLIYISAIPTAILGYLIQKSLSDISSLLVVGLGFLATGILMLVVDYIKLGKKQPKDASLVSGLIVGACQGIATLPGVSRYGITLSAGILCGYNRKFAIKYSFLMSIPAIMGALILEITDAVADPAIGLLFALKSIVGALVACITGLFCIRIMFRLIQKKRLRYFSFYCFIIGIVAIAGNFLL